MSTNTKSPSYNPKYNSFNNEFLTHIFKDDAKGTVFENKPHFYGLIQYKGHKVLVLGCTELMTWIATALARNNAVTYITHEKELYEKFIKTVNDFNFGSDDVGILCKDEKDYINKLSELKDMKFDKVIMNPPYSKSLHLDILQTVLNYSKEIVSLQPVRWLQDPHSEWSGKGVKVKYSKIIDNLTDVHFIFAKDAQRLFENAQFGMNLGIYYINTNNTNKYKYNYPQFVRNVMDFIYKKENNQYINRINIEEMKKDGWRVRIPLIVSCANTAGGSGNRKFIAKTIIGTHIFNNGLKNGKPWYEYYNKNQHSKTTAEISLSTKFNSEIEAENFTKCQQTDFIKYINKFIITDVNISDKNIIWLGNVKHPRTGLYGYQTEWTNDDMMKYFGMTEEDIKDMQEYLKDDK